MTEKQIYAFPIPDSLFLPHKVTSTFYAKVKYTVEGKNVNIEEVGLSPKCLKYINNTAALATKIEDELDKQLKKAISLNSLHPVFAQAIAPHI